MRGSIPGLEEQHMKDPGGASLRAVQKGLHAGARLQLRIMGDTGEEASRANHLGLVHQGVQPLSHTKMVLNMTSFNNVNNTH